ncbi:MAG: hypothetical protein HY666_00120 [Chloroflexi bacterium]|nr:hypothetical protein [Chloroflexota bacterium]
MVDQTGLNPLGYSTIIQQSPQGDKLDMRISHETRSFPLLVHTILVGLAIGAVMILGSYLGKRMLKRVPERLFPYVIEAVLIAAGLLFIVQGS